MSEGAVDRAIGGGWSGALFNRLAEVALARHPELAAIARALGEKGGREFHVTGSGAGLFAPCPGGAEAGRRLAAALGVVEGITAIHVVGSHRGGPSE